MSAGTRPVWLLDIDGVINAITKKPDPSVWPRDQWVRTTAFSGDDIEWPILAATPVLDFLRRVHEKGRAEIWWHSTWQHYSVNVGMALDLPEWPVLDCPEFAEQETFIATPLVERERVWWKFPAVQRLLVQGKRLLWTDDDAKFQLDFRKKREWEPQALVVAPHETTGLAPRHLRHIDRWLA